VKAYRAAFKEGFYSTDDSALVEKFCPNSTVRVIPGTAKNIKITTPEDIAFAEACLK
jgi:2-C-methyl-D-erythritol 4-phosphate cytidylyltransferase